jgi:hypothetical protein
MNPSTKKWGDFLFGEKGWIISFIFLFKNFSVSCFPLPLPSQKKGVHWYAHSLSSLNR